MDAEPRVIQTDKPGLEVHLPHESEIDAEMVKETVATIRRLARTINRLSRVLLAHVTRPGVTIHGNISVADAPALTIRRQTSGGQ